MEPDVANLPPPPEEEFLWLAQQPDDDGFPGQGGIVAYRMRMRYEAEERAKRFLGFRGKLHKARRPRVVLKAA